MPRNRLSVALLLTVMHGAVLSGTAVGGLNALGDSWRPHQVFLGPGDITSFLEDAGLVDQFVFFIDFDRSGKAWIATSVGLFSFDGYEWTRFSKDDGLPSNFVRSLLVASDGTLWIGTNNGIATLDDTGRISIPEQAGLAGPNVRRIVQDPDGTLWFCSDTWLAPDAPSGLTSYRDGKWRVYRSGNGLPSDYVSDYFRDSRGRQFVLTRDGLAQRKGDSWMDPLAETGFAGTAEYFWNIAETPAGEVVAVTSQAFFVLDEAKWSRLDSSFPSHISPELVSTSGGGLIMLAGDQRQRFFKWGEMGFAPMSAPFDLSGSPVYVTEAPDGSIWCVGHKLLMRWARGSGEWVEYSGLSAPKFVDRDGRIWFTAEQGVLRLTGDDEWKLFPHTVHAITPGSGDVVLGLSNKEVIKFEDDRVTTYGSNETGIHRILGHAVDGLGALCVYGLDEHNRIAVSVLAGESWATQTPIEIQRGNVHGCEPNPAGGVWFLTFDRSVGQSHVVHINLEDVREIGPPDITTWYSPNLHVDHEGSLWLYGRFGMYVSANDTWQRFEDIPGYSVDAVVSCGGETLFTYDDTRGSRLGVGRVGEGSWSHFALGHLDVVEGMSAAGTVFLAGKNVLYEINPQNRCIPQRLTVPLPDRIHHAVKSVSGDVWVGVADRVLRYRSDGLPPQTMIVEASDEVVEGDSLAVSFGAMERFKRRETGNFSYSWRFDDGPWTEFAPQPTDGIPVTVDAGNHSLEVRARDEGLDIDATPARTEFRVRACPLAQRPWFWPTAGAFLTVSALVAGIATVARRRARFYAVALENTVHERTAALERANRALQAEIVQRQQATAGLECAKAAAEEASQAKSILLANLCHEIRTPIMALLGVAEMYSEGSEGDGSGPRLADMLFRNARHLQTLFDDLLDAARLETGKFTTSIVECSLPEILADVRCVAEALERNSKTRFGLVCESPLPWEIHTDPTRLKQAVLNLVSNALKFTTSGYVYVRVRVERTADDPRLSISVEDTGPGIAETELERIFDLFEQVGPVGGDTRTGVGLGLPLARRIAEDLGGTLTVESQEGHGSRFTLRVATGSLDGVTWFPASDVDELWQPATAHAERNVIDGSVLLAEDSRDARELLATALRNAGASVTAVENGKDAVEAAESGPFDLVLLDIRMPVMDGAAAAAELRRQGCLTPIIALTATAASEERDRLLDHGFDDIWAKPISLHEVVDRAAAYLGSRSKAVAGLRQGAGTCVSAARQDLRMESLRVEFARGLLDRFRAIQAAVQAGDLQTAREALHQLAGTGGIMGFMPLSEEAHRLLLQIEDGAFKNHEDGLERLDKIVTEITKDGSAAESANA